MEKGKKIKSYVLRASRMSTGQKEALNRYSGDYCIPYSNEIIDYNSFFGDDKIYIEIGFGMGTATAEIAENNPDKNYLGIEVHNPGVGRLLYEINRRNLRNIRIINHDAVEVLEKMTAENSVSGFHIFFPDPWPKRKHHKRRIINKDFVDLLISRLEKGGYIYTATDWDDYAAQMFRIFTENDKLQDASSGDKNSPFERPLTSFEKKGIDKNHRISEFYFKCVK